MIRPVKIIPSEVYTLEIDKLMKLLHELLIEIPQDAHIRSDDLEAFKFIYDATFPKQRPNDLSSEHARIHVGLGDITVVLHGVE